MTSVDLTVLQADKDEVYRDIARIQATYRKGVDGITLPEGQVCRITAAETGRSTLIILRGRHGPDEPSIWIDERTRDDLGVEVGQEGSFRLETDVRFAAWKWAFRSSDVAYRICAQLALLSVTLGFLGLALGIISLFISIISLFK
jgi:hypothetical protein